MKNIIETYFIDSTGKSTSAPAFHPPATIPEIDELETKLSIKLPAEYKEFLKISNGFEGSVGQAYVRFSNTKEVFELTEIYGGEFFPWIIYIGTDGGNEMYVIDKRNEKLKFGLLPYISDENDFISLGDTFEEFIKHLYHNDFWPNNGNDS